MGLALGGGGARGLSHIAVLEAFDELAVKPAMIAGTSIGALIGAAYAAGMTAAEIHGYCKATFSRRGALLRHLYVRSGGRLLDYWRPGAPFKAERIFQLVLPPDLPKSFESLPIPLKTVATDFYGQCEYVTSTGLLLPALAASAALPALLSPVSLGGRTLIDGGFVNPLPFDLLRRHADFIVAVDVSGGPAEPRSRAPGALEALLGAQQIALRSIVNAKTAGGGPDVLVRPDVGKFGVFDFRRMDDILAASQHAKERVKTALRHAVPAPMAACASSSPPGSNV